jgi:hypothetical protein
MDLIALIASDDVLDAAFDWLCQRRQHHHYNSDVWQVRRWWGEKKARLQVQLLAGTFRFRELRRFYGKERVTEYWASLDALVLKAVAIVLTPLFQPLISPRCFHFAGSGGMKAAVREVVAHLAENTFVFRTDVKGYYASIDQEILLGMVREVVPDGAVIELIRGYLRRVVADNGVYEEITKGISLGCPLSPLMGALFLKPLDDLMGKMGLFYVRYMDDWVILAPTRWKLRGAVKAVQELMGELKLALHPDKTFIGRIARGFDFLGYWFSPEGLGITLKSVERMLDRVTRLYEQGAGDYRIEDYVRHWWRWVRCGVRMVKFTSPQLLAMNMAMLLCRLGSAKQNATFPWFPLVFRDS